MHSTLSFYCRELEKLPWHIHRRPSQFSAVSDEDDDDDEEQVEEDAPAKVGAAKVKFGQPETETETEEAEALSHAFQKPPKKKRHSRKKE